MNVIESRSTELSNWISYSLILEKDIKGLLNSWGSSILSSVHRLVIVWFGYVIVILYFLGHFIYLLISLAFIGDNTRSEKCFLTLQSPKSPSVRNRNPSNNTKSISPWPPLQLPLSPPSQPPTSIPSQEGQENNGFEWKNLYFPYQWPKRHRLYKLQFLHYAYSAAPNSTVR